MPRDPSTPHPAARLPRPSRRIHEEKPGKLPDGARCPECGASYRNGRWTWQAAPADAHAHTCPACERIASDHPAGVLRLEGDFARAHRDELIRLLRNVEENERSEHPLNRIMAVTRDGEATEVTVTDARLAEAFGRALARAHQGELELPPTTSDSGNLVRVRWARH